jgi:hypothetical protein
VGVLSIIGGVAYWLLNQQTASNAKPKKTKVKKSKA